MNARSSRRDLYIGGVAVTTAMLVGFFLGAAQPMHWMPAPPDMISGAHARLLPLPPEHPRPTPIDRGIDQLFFWPAGPGAGAGR